jgi:rare lipoprotein A
MLHKGGFFIVVVLFYAVAFPHLVGLAQAPVKGMSGPAEGICVYYNDQFQGHILASGEKYDKDALAAAHKTIPFGTMVKVTNLKNNKSIVVRINDRGPHGSKTKIIEVTSRAAGELDMIKDGKAKVQIEVVESGTK